MGKKKRQAPAKKGGFGPFSLTTIVVAVLVIAASIGAGVLIWALSGNDGGSSGGIKLPDFAYAATAPKDAAKAYQFALDSPDYLSQVPCYCGCKADGHKSNLDCFIKSRDGDKVSFDRHGAGWDLWVRTALDVLQWKTEGKPIKEIRKLIEDKYAGKYSQPTPTPPIEWNLWWMHGSPGNSFSPDTAFLASPSTDSPISPACSGLQANLQSMLDRIKGIDK